MQFEVSERIRTARLPSDIAEALEQQFRKTCSSVERRGDGFKAIGLNQTFGSINRYDEATATLRPVQDGFLAVADVYYRPSVAFWALVGLGVFGYGVLWIVPVIFYLAQKGSVIKSVEGCLHRVRNEFWEDAPSRAA